MKLIAKSETETRVLGEDFDYKTAYRFIFENDSDPEENPWLPGFDLILIDGDEAYILEADAWFPYEPGVKP